MPSKLDIYNMAISAARGQGNLSSLTQNTREREECDRWYDLVIRVVQEASYWDCCKTAVRLEGGQAEAVRYWAYRHALPADFLRAWYMQDMSKFELGNHEDTTVIFSNSMETVLYYAKLADDPDRWSNQMIQAIVYGLASKIARPLTGKEGIVAGLVNLANNYLQEAQSTALNASGNFLPAHTPDFITARGVSTFTETVYFYPFGESFSVDG